jgi:bifunctional ADP-heptose synthase (sugar kinase/adenylyltransferase)
MKRLALYADITINLVNPTEQNYLRYTAAKHIQQLKNRTKQSNNSKNSPTANKEWRIMKEIKHKLNINKLILTRVVKGRTIVILDIQEHHDEIMNFINGNFTHTLADPTKEYKKQ